MSSSSRPGTKTVVYHGDQCLGEAELFPITNRIFHFPKNEIRITHLSPHSERCPPLSILQTISPFSLRCRLLAKSATSDSPITLLYTSCFHEFRSAVVPNGAEELHLVAMPSKVAKVPSFWCWSVTVGLYNSCLAMLNLRCLSIVFDLDETLIVANTMKSFEDRIEGLSRRIDGEDDPGKVSGMSAELKRYIEDRNLLKQYVENNAVVDGAKMVTAQNEEVPVMGNGQEGVVRPVVRLPDKNIVLTRINPEIRDTSVIVRLRPAWEELRSYLTAKGRKRFEVYVCTMAERDYALEMWRLLDPEAHLISPKQLLDRVVCVKSGSRKSLLHVFREGICHPKMAMVIDDRLQVWDDIDQPRVHVVPPFSPYYAPQAEMANAVPILCVARNVACNVRGGFFKEFDENLMRRIFELCYENEMLDLPYSPDVSDYVMSEDTGVVLNNNRDVPLLDGMNGSGRRLNQAAFLADERHIQDQAQSAPPLSGSSSLLPSSLIISVLQEIGRRCDSKVEFRPVAGNSKELNFSVEVLFRTERIGIGMGRTSKEAQLQAAENALRNLASDFMSFIAPNNGDADKEKAKLSRGDDNGFIGDVVNPPANMLSEKDYLHITSTSQQLGDSFNSERWLTILSGIKELCTEDQNLVFQDQAPASVTVDKGEYYFQVELAGRVLGKGVGLSREAAKFQAAEEALKTLKASANPQEQNRADVFRPTKITVTPSN